MSQRFSYVKYDQEAVKHQETLKELFEKVEDYVDKNLKPGRAQSLVMTYLEIAYMWTGKALRDEQIARGSQVEHVDERTNE